MTPTRRDAAFGLCAALTCASARAADCPKPATKPPRLMWTERKAFTTGPLAKDWLAARFKAPAEDFAWPQATIQGLKSDVSPKSWMGKTILLTLWAEWCGPCLIEMPQLAALNARYASPAFAIVPVLTGSRTLRTPTDAIKVLAQRQAAAFDPLVDASPGGRALLDSLALTSVTDGLRDGCPVKRTEASLPCLVLIDPAGRVRGRSLGLASSKPKGNVWKEPAGEAFIKLLAAGAWA